MKFCGSIKHNIKNKCDTKIGGIKTIYLINDEDFVGADETSIYLTVGSSIYEIDAAKNTASITQNAIHNRDSYFVESTLSFSINKNSANFLSQETDLVKTKFKVLVEYWDRSWLLIDESPDFFFKWNSANKTSGINPQDFNGTAYQYILRGHSYGINYQSMPNVIIDQSTNPKWVLISSECEVI
jgi:hypothetical protein